MIGSSHSRRVGSYALLNHLAKLLVFCSLWCACSSPADDGGAKIDSGDATVGTDDGNDGSGCT